MGVVGWIVVGFVAGAFASAVTGVNRSPHGRRLGCLGTIAVGVIGGLLGGMLFNLAGDDGIGDFGFRSMFVAFIGATLLLLVVGAAFRRR
jgi:uncharacterized membrane protein YeaQ/YmgE (transglycosylase-associated protein family)